MVRKKEHRRNGVPAKLTAATTKRGQRTVSNVVSPLREKDSFDSSPTPHYL